MPKDLPARVLTVDLDGTLLRSDMLHETFWNVAARNWRGAVGALMTLGQGRAALKASLASLSDIRAEDLPFDDTVIRYIKDWREAGGKTVLVTASNQALADKIAAHLGLFDEVFGSDAEINLKGQAKADFLSARYQKEGFAYLGDASADLPVWQAARHAISAGVSEKLRSQIVQSTTSSEHLPRETASLHAALKAMRLHQWLKNLLVFIPMLAAHEFSGGTILQSVLAFAAFSAIASSVYLLNDLLDLSADRAHPRKRNRPFASGDLPLSAGVWMVPGLLLFGLVIAYSLGPPFTAVMLIYFAITLAYSLWLKRATIIDICVLAGLYTLRIIAGAAATDISLSVWLLGFSIFFFYSLAAVKRQAELVDLDTTPDAIAAGRGYRADDLPLITMMALSTGYVSILVAALYLNSDAVVALYSFPEALWGICAILIYWISRIVMLTHRQRMHDDPVVFAISDNISRACGVMIVILVLVAAA